jgi:hypothetical protein
LKSGEKPQKFEKQSVHNVVPLITNVPEEYKNCPPDLVWAIPLAMNQETPEFKAWMGEIEKRAEASLKAEMREDQKRKMKLLKK